MSRKKSQTISNNEYFIRFDKIREYYNISQDKFSKLLEISPGYYSEIKHDKVNISTKMIIALAKNFPQISINWLITGEGRMIKTEEEMESSGVNQYDYDDLPDDVLDLVNSLMIMSEEKRNALVKIMMGFIELDQNKL